MKKPVAICKNDKIFNHSTSWTPEWITYCEENNIPYEIVNCYSSDVVEWLPRYSVLLWNLSNYVISDLMEARNILEVADKAGLKVFPNHNTSWHFDDKIAETYALQFADAPIPKNQIFYLLDECIEWLQKTAVYPLIAKLRSGSGSNNVKLLKNEKDAVAYAKKMFSHGFSPAPSLMYKTYSKIQSTHDWVTFVARLKRVTEFLNTLKHAKQMPMEKGYCYFQEMIPNDGYDIKVAVVGDKMSYLIRKTRKGDFRASGGGDCYYERELITNQIIDSAFAAADRLRLQCIGFDYVVNNCTGVGFIIEMCYGFDHEVILGAGGYFDRNYVWHNEPLNVPQEVLANILSE